MVNRKAFIATRLVFIVKKDEVFHFIEDFFVMCIWIINYQAGQTVSQPIIQLFGFDSIYHETILVNQKYQWPIVQGLFKVKLRLIFLPSME